MSCALVTALVPLAMLVSAPVADAAGCPDQIAPPPAVDSSETLAPGELSPTPLPEPVAPAGGPRMGECDYILPPGAPPLPTDLGYQSWVLQDLDTGAILAAKDPHARERPASLIKMLLAQVVARNLDPNTPVTGTQDDANQQGSMVGVGPGGKYTVGLLVNGLLMASGNDCAHALAMQLGGMQVTVDKMNALARQLGATDTRTATPSGLDGPGMTSSAYDLSIFLRADLATPLLANAMHTAQLPFPGYGNKPGYMIDNDNLLLRTYPGDMGGKVGYTTDAQQTYANAAEQDGHRVALVMTRGDNKIAGRWQNARELMNYGFALENAHFAPVGHMVSPLAARSATTANNVVRAVPTTTGNAQVANVPTSTMSTFGNVGLPLTILAAIALVLMALMYMRRQKAKKARAAAAARVASAETIRVAVPSDLASARTKPVPDDDAITQSLPAAIGRPAPAPPQNQAQPPARPRRVMPPTRVARPVTPRQPTQRPSTTPSAPEWPTGPEWPT